MTDRYLPVPVWNNRIGQWEPLDFRQGQRAAAWPGGFDLARLPVSDYRDGDHVKFVRDETCAREGMVRMVLLRGGTYNPLDQVEVLIEQWYCDPESLRYIVTARGMTTRSVPAISLGALSHGIDWNDEESNVAQLRLLEGAATKSRVRPPRTARKVGAEPGYALRFPRLISFGGRQEAGRFHDAPGTDRTVPKPGQEEIGVCARPGTFPERHGSSRERPSEQRQLSRFVSEMINALERSSYTLLMLCACVPG